MTESRGQFRVHDAESEAVAEQSLNKLEEAKATVQAKYSHNLPEDGFVDVYLNQPGGGTKGSANVNPTKNLYKITILSPTTASDSASWDGYEDLSDPFLSVLTHEYSHIPFYTDLYHKEEGWTDDIEWLSQGLGEFVAENYIQRWVSRAVKKAESDEINLEKNPYREGLFAVEYLYEEFGEDTIKDVIRSPELLFNSALQQEVGVTITDLEAKVRDNILAEYP